jgi:hypothetical protein
VAADPDHVGLRRAGLADHQQQPGQDHSQRVPAQPTAPGGAGGAALQPPTTGDGRQGAHGATWKAAARRAKLSAPPALNGAGRHPGRGRACRRSRAAELFCRRTSHDGVMRSPTS